MEHGEWPGADGYPVQINTRPGRNRARLGSDYLPHRQTVYYQDGNGLLVPAGTAMGGGLHRSHSAAAARRPAQIVINNSQYEDRSVSRSPHSHSHNRRTSHGNHHYDDSEDEYHERAYSPHRRRRPSRNHESRSPSPHYDYELEKKMKKLEELEEKEKEDIAREKYEEEQLLIEAKKAKKKVEEEELKKKAIEEYHVKQLEEQTKKDKAKKKADEEFRERVKKTFGQAGYDEESIEKILKKGEKGKGHGHEHGHDKEVKIKDLTRPTYIKVHQKHVSPETLDEYHLPWEWDDRDPNYIIITRWIPQDDQIILFEHTKKLREKKQITDSKVELRRERDNLLLVRKKSPGRSRSRSKSRSWMFT